MRMLLVLLAMVSMVAFGDTHVEDERGLPGRLLGQKRERLKAKKERQRAKRARAAVSAEPEAPQPTCEGHQRVSSLSAVLPDALTPLPTRQILTDRAAKLAHVESMELRPNYLESLKKAGLAPSGKRLYLNLGARGFKDKSTTFFEKYPDASRFEHHAFEATPASMWRETMGWAAAAASDKRIELHNVAVWNKNTTLSFGIRKSASHVVESTSASAKSGKAVRGPRTLVFRHSALDDQCSCRARNSLWRR